MWRQNTFPEHGDSDLSISDEEEFNSEFPENFVSLGGNADKEESLQLQSRMETLIRGTHDMNHGRETSNLLQEKQISSFPEDEVEVPDSPDEGDFNFTAQKVFTCNLNEEVISDDEDNNVLSKFSMTSGAKSSHRDQHHNFERRELDWACTWSRVSEEAEALVRLQEDASHLVYNSMHSSSRASFKGVKGKSKPKLAFRFQSQKKGYSVPLNIKDEVGVSSEVDAVTGKLEIMEHGRKEHSIAEFLEDFNETGERQLEMLHAEVEEPRSRCAEQSMAELLDNLQDNSSLSRRKFKLHMPQCSRTSDRNVRHIAKASFSKLVDRNVGSEDLPEQIGSGSSSDNEANYENLQVALPDLKKPTMTDRFQEALGATCLGGSRTFVAAPNPSSTSLFGKLQHIMRVEKERDNLFLEESLTRASPKNEPGHVDVKILSRYLDAKLTVCHCLFVEDAESTRRSGSSRRMVTEGRKETIIFNPRVCSDIDLEVGNFIRVHPPWREVQLMGTDESILLSAYFSRISV